MADGLITDFRRVQEQTELASAAQAEREGAQPVQRGPRDPRPGPM